MALAKAFERYFYDVSLYESYFKKHIPSRGQYVALRHVTFVTFGLVGLIDVFFPFNPPFPTIGMCPNGEPNTAGRRGGEKGFIRVSAGVSAGSRSIGSQGWKGTWVCEPDKHKALEMYKEWKTGIKAQPAHH